MWAFQSTPARGGRQRLHEDAAASGLFQSTPARGGRPGSGLLQGETSMFQSTPARGGRQRWLPSRPMCDGVSIHARTRRATPHADALRGEQQFQSTPARGGRPCVAMAHCGAGISFNPRPHAAGDATTATVCRPLLRCFNPRPHAAGDASTSVHLRRELSVSIHARTRRATMCWCHRRRVQCSFNPRPHAAGDPRSA